jgi:hypothetical protein
MFELRVFCNKCQIIVLKLQADQAICSLTQDLLTKLAATGHAPFHPNQNVDYKFEIAPIIQTAPRGFAPPNAKVN